jgi:hypothetical protein
MDGEPTSRVREVVAAVDNGGLTWEQLMETLDELSARELRELGDVLLKQLGRSTSSHDGS